METLPVSRGTLASLVRRNWDFRLTWRCILGGVAWWRAAGSGLHEFVAATAVRLVGLLGIKRRPRPVRRTSRGRRLLLESCEQRELLSICTWTGLGSSSDFSDAANWSTGGVQQAPQAGDQLLFGQGAAQAVANNDFPADISFQSIEFAGAGNFSITGNGLALADGGSITVDSGVSSATIGPAVQLAGSATIDVEGGSLALTANSPLAGSGDVTKTGSGMLSLSGAAQLTGELMIATGGVVLDGCLGTGPFGSTPPARTATVTTLTSSFDDSRAGSPLVTFTATVTVPSGGSVPADDPVFLRDGSSAIGWAFTDQDGVATFSTAPLSAGNEITAQFPGDSALARSTSNLLTSSETSVASLLNPSAVGDDVTLVGVVDTLGGGPTPTGSLEFYSDGTDLGPATLDADGAATLTASGLALGTHQVTAVYQGDASLRGQRLVGLQPGCRSGGAFGGWR